MDGHNALSVLGLPFHLMITFSGLVLFMGMLMPAGILAVYDDARQFSDEVFASFKVTPPRARPRPLRALGGAGRKPLAGRVGRITVNNPAMPAPRDADAQRGRRRVYGRLSPYMRFDGVTGQMQETWTSSAHRAHGGVITGLHLGLFAAPLLRWFYFLVSLAGTGMVGTGLVLWIAKRRQKARPGAREAFSLRLVDGLNAGTVAGLFIAVAAFFWANRLLPDLPGRQLWEVRASSRPGACRWSTPSCSSAVNGWICWPPPPRRWRWCR